MVQKSLQPKNLNAQVVDLLGLRVINGFYAQGEQLPIEADLCDELGVSRPNLREAVKILCSKGLLTARTRVGTTVNERTDWNLLDRDVISWVIATLPEEEFLDMMFEARMAFEPHATALAAAKATDEDIAAIAQAYEDMASAPTVEASIEPDVRFHQAILDATKNDVIRYIGQTLHNALSHSFSLTSWHDEILKTTLKRHKAVYRAIAERNTSRAHSEAEKLLLESREDFNAKPRT